MQLSFEIGDVAPQPGESNLRKLVELLAGDMDFHGRSSRYASHNYHSFPAKFPPQLPRRFIEALTLPDDLVLDPMAGSGTTLVEAILLGRRAIGVDIDPLACLICRAKTTVLDRDQVLEEADAVVSRAEAALAGERGELHAELAARWDRRTRAFVDYWFAQKTQLALQALIREIGRVGQEEIRRFLEIALSSVIITKSGGVSLAYDLAHTRPQRAKVVLSEAGEVLVGQELVGSSLVLGHGDRSGDERRGTDDRRVMLLTKTLHSPLDEFARRVRANAGGLPRSWVEAPCLQMRGDAQRLPLQSETVDLIVTSPPYAANAIDYMRAFKFSLVWLGHTIGDLAQSRKGYVGSESIERARLEELPPYTAGVVAEITRLDRKRGLALRRYYAEMTRGLREMYRVLKPGRAAVVVVGSSVMRGHDTETQTCLQEIGKAIGFLCPPPRVRNLDRNRRMLPAGTQVDPSSMIQQRMHREYVLGLYKPASVR